MSRKLTEVERNNALKVFNDATNKQLELLSAMRVKPAQFNRLMLNCLTRHPDLARCSKASLYEAVYRCIEMRMVPDDKHGCIVPLNKKGTLTAEFWPMVDGILGLVRKSIPNIAIRSDSVHEGDDWQDQRGTRPQLVHNIDQTVDRTDANLVCVYSTAHFPGNEIPEFVVLYRPELMKFKKNNRGPWTSHPLEMFKVRALKRLLKRLPINPDLLADLAEYDEDQPEEEDQQPGHIIEGSVVEAPEVVEPPKPAPRQTKKKRTSRKETPPPKAEEEDDDFDLAEDEPDPLESEEAADIPFDDMEVF